MSAVASGYKIGLRPASSRASATAKAKRGRRISRICNASVDTIFLQRRPRLRIWTVILFILPSHSIGQIQDGVEGQSINGMSNEPARMRLPRIIIRSRRQAGYCVQPLILHEEQAEAEDGASTHVQSRHLVPQHAIERTGPYAEGIMGGQTLRIVVLWFKVIPKRFAALFAPT